MIADGKGVNDRIRLLYIIAKEAVKAVLIHALLGYGATEATEASAREWILRDVDHSGGIAENAAEALYHFRKIALGITLVGYNYNVAFLFLTRGLGNGDRCGCKIADRALGLCEYSRLYRPNESLKEFLGIGSAALCEKILHIGRKSANIAHSQIESILFNVFVRCHVIKVL
jgi:hypothetical protein